MDIISLAARIQTTIGLLEKNRSSLQKAAQDKAQAIAEYEKALSLTILRLKNGAITEFEGERIESLPASVLEKVARGIIWRERLAMERAEAVYRNVVAVNSALEAQLSAYQTLFKYLKEEVHNETQG